MAQQQHQRSPMGQPIEFIMDQGAQSPGLRRYYESPQARQQFREKVERGIGTAMDAMETFSTIMVNIGKVTKLPFLAESAGLVVTLIDIVAKMKSNKEKFRSLTRRTARLVSIIYVEIAEKNRPMSSDLYTKLLSVHAQLQEILTFAMKKPEENRLRRAIGRKPDADMIDEYEKRLDQALNEFNFQNQITQTAILEQLAARMGITDDQTEDVRLQMITDSMDQLSLSREEIEREKRELEEAREKARLEREEADREAAERRAREDAEWQAKRQAEELVEHVRREKEKRDREAAAKAEDEKRKKEREDWQAEQKAAAQRAEAEKAKREQMEADERDRIRYAELNIRMKEERLKKKAAEEAEHKEIIRRGEQVWAESVQKEEERRARKRAQEAKEHEEKIERLRKEAQAMEADKRRREAEEARREKEETERRCRARASRSNLELPESNSRPHRHSWNSSSQQDYSSPPPSSKNPFRRTPVQSPDPYPNDPYQDDGYHEPSPPHPRRPARRNYDYYPDEIPAFSPSPPLYGPEAGRQFLNSGNVSSTYISGSFNNNSVVYGSSRRRY